MSEEEAFKQRIRGIHELYQKGDFAGALAAITAARPADNGWLRYYAVLCYFRMRRAQQAFDLLVASEPSLAELPADLHGYVLFVGSELAFRLNRPAELVRWAHQSVDLRLKARRTDLAVESARRVCDYLPALEGSLSPALPFARLVLAKAPGTPAASTAVTTLLALAREARSAPLLRECLDCLVEQNLHLEPRGLQLLAKIEQIPGFAQVPSPKTLDAIKTALQFTRLCETGPVGAVAQALASGARTSFQWSRELSHPLAAAAFRGQLDIVRLLLTEGAEVDSVNPQGDTALMLAARQGQAACVGTLLSAGASPRRTNLLGQTALHLAVVAGSVDVVRELMAVGADVEALDTQGLSPRALALSAPAEVANELGVPHLPLVRPAPVVSLELRRPAAPTPLAAPLAPLAPSPPPAPAPVATPAPALGLARPPQPPPPLPSGWPQAAPAAPPRAPLGSPGPARPPLEPPPPLEAPPSPSPATILGTEVRRPAPTVAPNLLGRIPAGVLPQTRRPAPPPPPARLAAGATQALGLCSKCSSIRPTRKLHFYRHVGLVAVYFHQEMKGEFCRSCAVSQGAQSLATCLVVGWWGVLSLFINTGCVLANLFALILGLTVKRGESGPPLHLNSVVALNGRRAAMLEGLKKGTPLAQVASDTASRTDVPPEQVLQYLRLFIG